VGFTFRAAVYIAVKMKYINITTGAQPQTGQGQLGSNAKLVRVDDVLMNVFLGLGKKGSYIFSFSYLV
jgi:hypothetical protein